LQGEDWDILKAVAVANESLYITLGYPSLNKNSESDQIYITDNL